MFLPPLFKVRENDVQVGGGIKIVNVPSKSFRARPELRVQRTDRNVTVTYDTNVRDLYGSEIVDMDVDLVTHTSAHVDVRGYDNFVNPRNSDMRCILISLRSDSANETHDLNLRSTISLLSEMGASLELRYENTTVTSRSELIRNNVNDNRSIRNKSRLFTETSLRKAVFAEGNIDTYLDTQRLQTYRWFGPHRYDVVCVFNDGGITYTSMKRTVFVHGVYDVVLRPLRTSGVQTGVNLDDSVVVSWKSSQPGVKIVQLRDGTNNVLATDSSANVDSYVVSLAGFEYRGELRGYVQYEDVFWSPYNYSNSLVLETSNVPVKIEFRVSNEEKYDIGFDELYVQLTTLDMGSVGNTGVFVRTITVRMYEDEARTIQAGDTVQFKGLYESQIVRNLAVATAYYMSYDSDDALNPAYSDIIDARYSTRVDPSFVADTVGPEVDLRITSTNPILFSANISDASYLVKLQFALFSDLEVENVTTYQQWTPIPITELRTQMTITNQEVFVYYKDTTNVQPFLVMLSTLTSFRLVFQAIDINNNSTTKRVNITL